MRAERARYSASRPTPNYATHFARREFLRKWSLPQSSARPMQRSDWCKFQFGRISIFRGANKIFSCESSEFHSLIIRVLERVNCHYPDFASDKKINCNTGSLNILFIFTSLQVLGGALYIQAASSESTRKFIRMTSSGLHLADYVDASVYEIVRFTDVVRFDSQPRLLGSELTISLCRLP